MLGNLNKFVGLGLNPRILIDCEPRVHVGRLTVSRDCAGEYADDPENADRHVSDFEIVRGDLGDPKNVIST